MDLLLRVEAGPQPFYRRLVSALRTSLDMGQIRCGELLPSTRRLADSLGVHRHTIMTALDELVAEGWLQNEPGRGYRVLESLPAREPSGGDFPYPLREMHWRSPLETDQTARFRFPSGVPDLRSFPAEEYYSCVREALRRCPPADLLGYSHPAGRPNLRSQLARYLRRNRNLQFDDEQLVITHGCQEAVFLLSQLLLEPGDGVAIEELGFPAIWDAMQCNGARLFPVALDEEGINPAALEAVLKTQKIRLIYLTPEHQYPTTVSLSLARRRAIYELARRYDACILEDDYDHEFHYRCQPLPPMKAYDPEGIVLYCSTFSKVMHASVRLGFAIVPRRVAVQLTHLKQVSSRQNDNLSQESVALWMEQGGFERHLRRMRRLYQGRRDVMLKALGDRARFASPDGGMCVWADFGTCTSQLAQVARQKHSVDVRPGNHYQWQSGTSHFLRLGFAYATEEEIRDGISLLLSCLC